MELRQLRHFLAVAQAGTFSRAGEVLHMSQPAVSQSIARLERLVGQPLLLRDKRTPGAGVRLTPAGEVLMTSASIIVDEADRVLARVRRVSGPDGRTRLTIGFASSTPAGFISAALRLPETVPDLEIAPVHLVWGDEHESLRSGRVDLAFMQYPPGSRVADYAAKGLARVERVVVLPATHPLAGRETVSVAELASERVLDPGYGHVEEMHRDFWLGRPHTTAMPHSQIVQVQARTVEEMFACVAGGMGLAFTSASLATTYTRKDVVFARVEELGPVEVGVVRLASDRRKDVLRAFRALSKLESDPEREPT